MSNPNQAALAAFAAAWREQDLDALVALLTDDVEYRASVGPEPGTTYRGRAAVRAGFAAMFAYDQAVAVRGSPATFVADRAYVEWEYDVIGPGSKPVAVRGIDVFGFVNGRIALKDAFRKTYPSDPRSLA